MVTLGVDSHKRTHTAAAVDANGCKLAHRTFPTTAKGHADAIRWARQWPQRRWALEDCRPMIRRLEGDLLRAGEAALRVPPKLTGKERKLDRASGKSDPIDALAVARAALRVPDLPVACLDGPSRDVRLLVDHREDLVAERTRIENRLHGHLHELDLDRLLAPRSLERLHVLDELEASLAPLGGVVAEIALELVRRVRQLTRSISQLERRIEALVSSLTPSLLELAGCGALTAAKLVGEVAGIARFRSRAAFAMFNGTAPIPVWSGNRERHRLNRGGNRQVNAALHRIAVTQLQRSGPGRDYLEHRLQLKDTKTEAIRALRRRISDEVYRRMIADELALTAPNTHQPHAA